MWPSRREIRRSAEADTRTSAEVEPGLRGNAFGWHAHTAVQAWTASVDVKSSIVVVIETAVAGASTRALITEKGELHTAVGLHLATAITATVSLVMAVALALWVVFPRLARRRTSKLSPTGLIYFGHLRDRTAEDINNALATMTPSEERWQLAQQLHVTGAVAWRKHACLQASLILFAVGSALLVLAYVAY